MTTQAMVFELKVNGETVDKGMVNGVGVTTEDICMDVVGKLEGKFNVEGLEFFFADVSNTWTFEDDQMDWDDEGNEIGNVYVIEFAPFGMNADKFGTEEECNG